MSYDATVLADAPLVYLKMAETSGTTANDSSGNGQNGTLHGTITLNQAKIASGLNACMKFDGSSGYISIPTATLPSSTHDFTLECWIYCATTHAGYGVAFSYGANVANEGATLYYGDNGFHFDASIKSNNFRDGGAISALTAYHWCVTLTSGTLQEYVNGSAVGGSYVPSPSIAFGAVSLGQDLGGGTFWPEYMSNAAIYGSALSGARILAHYNAGITASATHLRISDGYGGVFS